MYLNIYFLYSIEPIKHFCANLSSFLF